MRGGLDLAATVRACVSRRWISLTATSRCSGTPRSDMRFAARSDMR